MASWRWAVWWCAGWAALAAPAAGESFLNDIGRNLRAEMAGVLEMAVVNYSEPVLNVTYVASVEFDMRAMGAIYNATPVIIDAIAHKQAYPEGMVTVVDGHVELPEGGLRTHWRPLLSHYAGPAAVLAVALLLVAALPLAGLFWCCCYWCRGGQRRRPFDRKYDACLKAMLAILLIGFLTLFLFGIVCAFATDSQAEEGLAGAGGATRAALQDAKAFIDASQRHADHLLVKNYQELEKKLNAILTSSGLTISVQLGEFSRAVSVTALTGMVRRLDVVRTDLRTVQALTVSLRSNAEQLNAALRRVRAQLLETLARCSQPQCIQLQEKHKIGQLDTEIHYSQMPDVSELLGNVTALLESNIKAEVEEGQNVFRNIQREVQRSVDEHIPSVQDAVAEAGRKLAQAAADLKRVADETSEALDDQHVFADSMDELYRQYGPYRRYVGIGAATALLTVMALVSWGLLCGVCGKRPDVYGASDCCNKGAGSKALLCGTGLMFAVGGAAALVLAAYFAVGVAAQRFVCDPLTEPRGSRVFRDLEKFVQLDAALFGRSAPQPGQPGLNLTTVLLNCHQNHTIYQTFQLSRLYDLPSLQSAVADEVSRRARLLGPPKRRREPLVILKDSAKSKLRQLAATGLSEFDFDRILHALETNMTSLALDGLAGQLEAAARALAPRPAFAAVADSLATAAAKLRQHHRDILMPMINDTERLNQTALKLRDSLRFNHSSLKEAIAYLMHETQQAEAFLNTRGPDLVQNMTMEFAEVVAALMTQYMERVSNAALNDVGRCGPLSNAFNATRDAHCRKILMPVNGYWVSLAWCLALSVAVMALSARLARLYRNLDPYPGPLVEAEYLYDAYADRDNVPLANAYKAEKRAGRDGRRGGGAGGAGGGGGPAGGGGGAGAARGEGARGGDAAVAPPVDAHHARRYNDMAPKHWEEGPPRYHGPTEYERPPPYYYPGPADRQ